MKTNFDTITNRLGTFCTQWDYIEDRFGEKELLPFSVSDTDFRVPEEITTSLKKRLEHDIFGYTRWNHPTFKNAVLHWYDSRFNSQLNSDWLVYSPSVIYSISQLINSQSQKGDGVLIQTPAYDAFFKTIKANQRQLIENPLRYENGHYEIDFDLLDTQLAVPTTTIFLLCSPHNPTGRVWRKEELRQIIDLCQKHQVFLISDDIHMDVLRQERQHIPLTNLSTTKLAICTSASKTFNIPGLIFSYVIIPDPTVRETFLQQLKEKDGLSSSSIFGMYATVAAYTECHHWVDDLNEYIDTSFNLVENYLKEQLPAISLTQSEATYLAWLDVSQLPYTSDQLQQALISIGKVAIMPGATYGTTGEHFLRLNLGCAHTKLLEGLTRLKKAIEFLEKDSKHLSTD